MNPVWVVLADAIVNNKQVTLTYHGLPREMCPHVLGFKRGNEHCLFYQFGGSSSRGIYPLTDPKAYMNWRCLDLPEISNVVSRIGEWYSISRHSSPQTCIDDVRVEVSGWE